MGRHRNSQKRVYIPGAAYFITTVTYGRYPYFEEDPMCEFFMDHLRGCRKIHDFIIHACAVMPDHVHVIIRPGEKSDFSIIIGSLKRCFARDVNNLLSISGDDGEINPGDDISIPGDNGKIILGDDHDRRLFGRRPEGVQYSFRLKREFEIVPLKRYTEIFNNTKFRFKRFKWQKSFHHRIIFNEDQMRGYSRYIKNQPVIHGANNAWVWVGSGR